MVRTVATAADSFAACRDRSKLGMAIVAMIRMIATTIKSSISENPLFGFISIARSFLSDSEVTHPASFGRQHCSDLEFFQVFMICRRHIAIYKGSEPSKIGKE